MKTLGFKVEGLNAKHAKTGAYDKKKRLFV